ncbi:hypothetical protein [Alicyclobacillus sp. SO9]|uniref:hypothetical protein n=1 Tax=Alicyclobacillus sp. SO9 TaxID=2665646 RepID=UPI0018E8360E|nr:hypothetical protein [Alicyclobacillus sp. SO9]QQE80298.1 hypothetical protein GI364_07695 [Alicyclobacillus sp. SO9]
MDPLEWTHQWDNYEMMMYVETEGEHTGIFMQVSQRDKRDGAEEWEILYNRKLSDYSPEAGRGKTDFAEWEDAVLRDYLHQHPHLVRDEKAYFETRMAGEAHE